MEGEALRRGITRARSGRSGRRTLTAAAAAGALLAAAGQAGTPSPLMSFFVSSVGSVDLDNADYSGGNLGGLAGADALCTDLAAAVGATAGGRTWRAYLSTTSVNARDRIGQGPWHNAAAQLVAPDVAVLHQLGIAAELALDENGDPVPPEAHDILTGASEDGGLHPLGASCGDFQANDPDSWTSVGHSDGGGVGQGGIDGGSASESWNSAHLSNCTNAGLIATSGRGRVYCFSPEGSSATPGPTSTPAAAPSSTPTRTPTPTAASQATPTPTAAAQATPTRTPADPASPTTTPTPPASASLSVPLTLQDFSGVARTAEPVRSGVPIPRAAQLFSIAALRLLGPDGTPVPARFQVLGRWDAGPADGTAPIRWLLVELQAHVPAGGSRVYTLQAGGDSAPAPGAIAIADAPEQVTVTTGPARFVVSRQRGSLLDEVWLDRDGDGTFDAGERVVAPGADLGPFVQAAGTEYLGANGRPSSVLVEDAGPGRATVRVEGFHQARAGQALLRYVTRLSFFAGSSAVHVHHTVIEGRVAGNGNEDFEQQVQTPLERAGLRLRLELAGTTHVRITADAVTSAALTSVSSAALRQRRVTDWRQPQAFELLADGVAAGSGQRATNGWLDLADSRWGLGVATRDFWRKSPQELHAAGDGTIEVAFPSEPYAIYQAMGYAEEVLLDFHLASAPASELQARAQGFLKDPLFAVAPAAWYSGSEALGELSPAPAALYPRYDEALEEHYEATAAWIDEGHAWGLLNWFDLPADRFDASPDPDQIGWGNSYYNAAGTAIRQLARSGELKWLRDLAGPQVRHWYTTDCYDTDEATHPFNGISGLRGRYHRGGFTGEYHYMEALWDYYYLTGDPRALERGLAAARSYATAPNWRNDYDLGIGEPGLTTRMIAQKIATLHAAYLASGDGGLLAALVESAEDTLAQNGTPEGFVKFSRGAAGSFYAEQGFMMGNLYLPALYHYWRLTGSPAARALLTRAPRRLLEDYRCTAGNPCPGAGVGCTPGVWDFYNIVQVQRLNGGYTVGGACVFGDSDDHMYDSGLLGLVAGLCRGAQMGGGEDLRAAARAIFEQRFLPRWAGDVLDKEGAAAALRAAEALACLDPGSAPTPTPTAGVPIPSGAGGPALALVLIAAAVLALRRRRAG
jgi:hypothetical protein